jgi:glycerol-3-phosphate dehydrogenase subunit B
VTRRVLVIGAGAAGMAAAWSARQAGHEVTVVSRGAGASALGGGAVDDVPWEERARAARTLREPIAVRPLDPGVRAIDEALGLWAIHDERPAWLPTLAGRIRPARGRDRALLDLAGLEGTRVILPRADRAGWDADAIAAALSADPFARARRIAFVAVDVPVLRFAEERRIADGDLAMRHDDDARIGWLADRLREGAARLGGAGAVLLGPWLGASRPRAEALAKAAGMRAGEALAGAGSPAGLRFEAARDRLLQGAGARVVIDRVTRIDRADRLLLALERDERPIAADAVVLAIGGLAGGGVIYSPAEHGGGRDLPPGGAQPFSLSVDAAAAGVEIAGALSPAAAPGARAGERTSSLHGPALDLIAWPTAAGPGALETIGIRCEGARAAAGIAAAGDAVAGRSRTLLEAVASGLAAGAHT